MTSGAKKEEKKTPIKRKVRDNQRKKEGGAKPEGDSTTGTSTGISSGAEASTKGLSWKKKTTAGKIKKFFEHRKTKTLSKVSKKEVRAAETPKHQPDIREADSVPSDREENKAEKPSQEKPKVAEEKPKAVEEKPKVAEEKPKAADEKPKITDEKTKNADEKPKITDEKTKNADDKPKNADEKPKNPDEKPKLADEATKPTEVKVGHVLSRARKNKEKSKTVKARQKTSAGKKPATTLTPIPLLPTFIPIPALPAPPASSVRQAREADEGGKEPSMEVDDEGESRLIPIDKAMAKGGGKKEKKEPGAPIPSPGNEKKEKEGKKTPAKTPQKDMSAHGAGVITMYDTSKDKTLMRLSCVREIDDRGWPECAAEFKKNHKPNPEINRDTRYVLTFNVPPDGDFYDANKVEIPGVDTKFIMAAAPLTETSSRENFWRLVYDSNVATIVYVEEYDVEAAPFMPWKMMESKSYGKMDVINKKTENMKEGVQSVLEVLPEGCSNSIIVRFIQCHKWPEMVIRERAKFHELNHPVCFTRLIKDDKGLTMVVCSSGMGKSAMFVMLHAAITILNASSTMQMADILDRVRHDRWGSIQTLEQYLTLYQLFLYYIAAKSRKGPSNEACREVLRKLIAFKQK